MNLMKITPDLQHGRFIVLFTRERKPQQAFRTEFNIERVPSNRSVIVLDVRCRPQRILACIDGRERTVKQRSLYKNLCPLSGEKREELSTRFNHYNCTDEQNASVDYVNFQARRFLFAQSSTRFFLIRTRKYLRFTTSIVVLLTFKKL